jgi:hypothetical protein
MVFLCFFVLYTFLTIIPITSIRSNKTVPILSIANSTLFPCHVKIINPRPGDRFRPGDEINVKWDLIGPKCRNPMDGLVPLHQINAILFANLTRKDEWKWDYRLVIIIAATSTFIISMIIIIMIFITLYYLLFKNLYQEINTSNITSFTYPIQIILSPNIRDSSLYFLDIELIFTVNPPELTFDVVGPFTILPIPEGQDIFSGSNNSDNSSVSKVNSADILTIGIDWICMMFGIIFAINHMINA